MSQLLYEDMTFDELFRYSEPKRIKRSTTVRGPPLQIDANSDTVYHTFNFKSFPSTTGLRHHGFIKFKKPPLGNASKRLQHIPCEVDCTCPDYRYRFAWVNKQKKAGRVGANSMNQAWNKAPNQTNPSHIPGLCKHILACREYIYGLMAKFPGGAPDTGERMTQLVKYADRRWSDFDGLMAKAKDTEKWYKAMKAARNAGQGADMDYVYRLYIGMGGTNIGVPKDIQQKYAQEPGAAPEPPEAATLPPRTAPPRRGPILPAAGKPTAIPTPPPPGGRGSARPKSPGGRGTGRPPTEPPVAPPRLPKRPWTPPTRESIDSFARVDNITHHSSIESVISLTPKSNCSGCDGRVGIITTDEMSQNMTTLKDAYTLVEEIEHDEVATPSAIATGMADRFGGEDDMSQEPPVDDSAIGADTEGNVALQLLGDIKELISQLVAAELGEPEMGEPGEEVPGEEGPGPGGPHAIDALPEPDEEEEEEEDEEEGVPPRHQRAEEE